MIARPKRLPGPTGIPLLGAAHNFLGRDLLAVFLSMEEKFGPLYQVPLPLGHHLVMVAHPDAVEHVLRTNPSNYVKGSVYDGTRLLLGNGLVTSEGKSWQRQRELAKPAFTTERLCTYLGPMAECTERLLADWGQLPNNEPIDLFRTMTRLTLAIVGETLFGVDLSDQQAHAGTAFEAALDAIGRRGPGGLQIPLWIPTPGNIRFRRVLSELDELVYALIERARQVDPPGRNTLLHTLMEQYAGRDDVMDNRQLRDQVITLYLAGHETTASLLTWAFYCLASRTDIEERVREETGAIAPSGVPTLEQLKQMEFTLRVVKEVLRLYPPAWTIARNALDDDQIMGYPIPRGAIVLLSPYLTHRQARFWPDPERFAPDRFTETAVKSRHPFAFFPFSLGPRIWIGMHFSLYEAVMILTLILREYRLRNLDPSLVGVRAAGTLRPARKILMNLERIY